MLEEESQELRENVEGVNPFGCSTVRHLCEDGSVESCHVRYTYFENLAEVFFSLHCRYIIVMWPTSMHTCCPSSQYLSLL